MKKLELDDPPHMFSNAKFNFKASLFCRPKQTFETRPKLFVFKLSNSVKKLIKIFWAQTFWTQSLSGPNFFKQSIPGDLPVFRAFASLLSCLSFFTIFFIFNLFPSHIITLDKHFRLAPEYELYVFVEQRLEQQFR